MIFKQYEIWLADLNPQFGTESGKIRPVLIVQTDFLNLVNHSSVIICPITTNIVQGAKILRVHLKAETSSIQKDCDIMIDQIRAIDTKRLLRKLGELSEKSEREVVTNLLIVLNLK